MSDTEEHEDEELSAWDKTTTLGDQEPPESEKRSESPFSWMNKEEIPFYLELIDQINEKIENDLKNQEIKRKRRKLVVSKITENDVIFKKREKQVPDLNSLAEEAETRSDEESKRDRVNFLSFEVYENPGAKLPECSVCKIIFPTVASYKEHMKSGHASDLPYVCEVCFKGFRKTYLLKQHKRYHGEKTFSCGSCGEAFIFKALLKRHELVHSKERQHVCPICSLSFAQLSHLQSHELIHSTVKNFECLTCDKKFLRKNALDRHCRRRSHVS